MNPPVPAVPGYAELSFLRHGRFGDLFRAVRESDGRTVEVKLLRRELYKDGEAIRRFQREVRLLVDFAHPSLLHVLDHGLTPAGDPWLALEHKEGQLLSDVLAHGALPLDRARKIGAQVARVLSSAALHGIVHRGLAPAAILVCANDEVKVLDFGLAVRSAPDRAPSLEITEQGQRIGDPEYMAPEAIDAGEADERADRYALGVLLYALVVGHPPFVGPALTVLAHQVETPAPAPSAACPGLPPWFDAVVLALLEKDPAARPDLPGVARALVAGAWPPPLSMGTVPPASV